MLIYSKIHELKIFENSWIKKSNILRKARYSFQSLSACLDCHAREVGMKNPKRDSSFQDYEIISVP